MRSKNLTLIAFCLGLILVNLLLFFIDDNNAGNVRKDLFDFSDTTSIRSIDIIYLDEKIALKEEESAWHTGDGYRVDGSLRNVLFAVLSRLEVTRKVGGELEKSLLVRSEKEGAKVCLPDLESDFTVIGNENKTKTFFIANDKSVYEVGIPGYSDYLGAIFTLSSVQWRDRLVFDGSVRTIQSVNIDFESSPDLSIQFEDGFFRIENVTIVDTTKVEDYLNLFSRLQANERIEPGSFNRYDSLSSTTPTARIAVKDLRENTLQLSVFPSLEGENFHLTRKENGELLIFDNRRIHQLLRLPQYFQGIGQ